MPGVADFWALIELYTYVLWVYVASYASEFWTYVALSVSGIWAYILPGVEPFIVYLSATIIGLGVLQNLVYLFQLFLAYAELRINTPLQMDSALWRLLKSDVTMPISLLVPAYNEETTIVDSVTSLMALHYPNFEIIVVNDGSSDGTLAKMLEAFDLKPTSRSFPESVPHKPIRGLYASPRYPKLFVVDKANGGKSDALNAGINLSRFPLFCTIDADSILEADALLRAVQPFVDDPKVVAVGGTIRIANGCRIHAGAVTEIALPRQILPLFQTVEYLRAFLIARLAWSRLKTLLIISGAFGVFKRQIVVEVGGYSHGTVGEDIEIIVKIHRHMRETKTEYRMHFLPEPVCWTEAPTTLRALGRQRSRWQRGALETFFKHKRMALNPRYGVVGLLGFGNSLLVDVLGPPLEVLGLIMLPIFWSLGLLSATYVAAFYSLSFVFGVFISVGSLFLEELELRRYPRARDLIILTLAAVAENFGYRQMNNLWRIRGYWQFLTGAKSWGHMTRAGFSKT